MLNKNTKTLNLLNCMNVRHKDFANIRLLIKEQQYGVIFYARGGTCVGPFNISHLMFFVLERTDKPRPFNNYAGSYPF